LADATTSGLRHAGAREYPMSQTPLRGLNVRDGHCGITAGFGSFFAQVADIPDKEYQMRIRCCRRDSAGTPPPAVAKVGMGSVWVVLQSAS
jgi:hypothetical protein